MSTWKLDKHLLREMEREAEVEDKAEAAYLADLELRRAVRTRLHDLGAAPSDVAAWLRERDVAARQTKMSPQASEEDQRPRLTHLIVLPTQEQFVVVPRPPSVG